MSEITEFLEQQAILLADNVTGWEARTLQRIGRRIKNRSTMTLAELKAVNNIVTAKKEADEIFKDLAAVTGYNIRQIENIYTEVLVNQHESTRALYDYRNMAFVPFEENETLQAIVKAFSRTTAETMFNLSMTKALQLGFADADGKFVPITRKINDVLDKAVMSLTAGGTDFRSAMRDVMVQLGTSGIRVNYGSGITRRLDTVVRQNLLWGAKQASIEYNNNLGEELGCNGIEIDWHNNPRPSHEFMQGKQYSLVGTVEINGKRYESADRALIALNDYGCLHFKTPIILGVSEPVYNDEQLATLNAKNRRKLSVDGIDRTGYEWEQRMRIIETEVRKEKEIITGLNAIGDKEGAKLHRKRIKDLQQKYDNICVQTGLTPQKERMRVFKVTGNDKNFASTLENVGESGIIKENSRITKKRVSINYKKTSNYNTNNAIGSSLWSDEKRKKLLDAEKSLLENKFETAIIYDFDGNFSFKKDGDSDSVCFTKRQLRAMKNKIVTHNHPNGSCFSSEDIFLLMKTGAAELRDVTKNGTFIMNPPKTWPDEFAIFEQLDKTYNDFLDNAIIKFKDKAAQEGKPLLFYLHQAEVEGTKAFCDKHGIFFRMESCNS